MTSFSILDNIEKSKFLNTFENTMENRAFGPWSKCSIFHNILHSISRASKGGIMELSVKTA